MADKIEHFNNPIGLTGVYANGSFGAVGSVLTSDGTNVYWAPSSGGDADTLDGYDSTDFLLLDDLPGYLDDYVLVSDYEDLDVLAKILNVDGSSSGLDADLWDGNNFSDYLDQAVKTTSSPTFAGATISDAFTGVFGITLNATDSYAIKGRFMDNSVVRGYFGANATDCFMIWDASGVQRFSFQGGGTPVLYINGNQAWHAGNDGSGSTLDADLWDGNNFSDYLDQAVKTTSIPTFSGLYTTGLSNPGAGWIAANNFRAYKSSTFQQSDFIGDGQSSFVSVDSYGTGQAFYRTQKARNTLASPQILQTNDVLGQYNFNPHTGSGFILGASFYASLIEGTPSTSAMQTRMNWSVIPAGSVTSTLGMYFDHTAGLVINPTSPTWILTMTKTDNGATGAGFKTMHETISPAANDVYAFWNMHGRDSAGNDQIYNYIQAIILNATSGLEASEIYFGTAVAGTTAVRYRIGAGFYYQGGTDPGAGAAKFNGVGNAGATAGLQLTGSFGGGISLLDSAYSGIYAQDSGTTLKLYTNNASTVLTINGTLSDINTSFKITGDHLRINHTLPQIKITETDAGTNLKVWGTYAEGGTLYHQLVNDAESVGTIYMRVTRSTHTSATIWYGTATGIQMVNDMVFRDSTDTNPRWAFGRGAGGIGDAIGIYSYGASYLPFQISYGASNTRITVTSQSELYGFAVRYNASSNPIYFGAASDGDGIVANAAGTVLWSWDASSGLASSNYGLTLGATATLLTGVINFHGVSGDSNITAQHYALYQQDGAWSSPYPDLMIDYHTGIAIGANSAYGGTRIYNNSSPDGSRVMIFSVADGDNSVRFVTNNWHKDTDSYDRFYFSANSTTYYKTRSDHRWRNSSDSDIMTLDSSGNLVAVGNVTAFSDEILKYNKNVIENALSKITSLNGYTYDRHDIGGRHTGLIAQEVEKVLPEVVGEENGIKNLAYGNMMGLVVEAFKEMKREISTLKEEIALLRGAS